MRRTKRPASVGLCALGVVLLLLTASNLRATDGAWAVDADGYWSGPANWAGGIVADGAGSTAVFDRVLTGMRTVTLDANRSLGNLVFGNSSTFDGNNWTLAGNHVLTLDNSGSAPVLTCWPLQGNNSAATLSCPLAGSVGLIKQGAGTLILSGSNSFTGGLSVSQGTLKVTGTNSLGLPSVPANLISVAPGASFDFNSLSLNTYYPPAGGYTITIAGYGLNASNGAVFSSLNAANNKGLPNLRLAADASVGNNAASTFWILGKISGPWSLNKVGTSTVVIDGAASLAPEVAGLVVSNGTLTVTPGLGAVPVQVYGPGRFSLYTGSPRTYTNRLTLNEGSTFYKDNVSDTWSGPVTLNGKATIQVAGQGGSTLTIAGPISGAGSLTKTGTNALLLTGTNVYTGGTTVSAGTLQLGDRLVSNGSITGDITNNAILAFANPVDQTYGGSISGAGTLVKTGPGALTLTGLNACTGGTIVNAGKLLTTTANGAIAVPYSISNAATLSVSLVAPNATFNMSSLTAANSSVLELNLGVLDSTVSTNPVLTVSSTVSLASNATLQVRAGSGLSPGQFSLLKYGNLVAAGLSNLALVVPPGVTASLLDNSTNRSLDLNITAIVPLVWDGTINGNWDSTTPNWRPGTNYYETAGGPAVLFDDTASTSNTTITAGSALTVTPLAVTVSNNNKAYSIGGMLSIAGNAALTKSGAGALTLSGANTYAGGTTLCAGQLCINNGGAGGNSSAIGLGPFTVNGGRLDNTSSADVTLSANNPQSWNGDFAYAGSFHSLNLGSGPVTLAGKRQVTVQENTLAVGGVIAGPFSLTKAGPGTLLLSGLNTYSGGTTVSQGTLQLGDGTANNGSVPGDVLNNATLKFSNPADQSYAGTLSGSGALVKNGAGALTLVGANSYAGGTVVSQGLLKIVSTNALGVPSVAGKLLSVAPGGSFDFSGLSLNSSYPPSAGYTITIAGYGLNASNGAVVSSASAANNRGLPGLRLAADASIGNNANSTFWVEGPVSGPYTLTKVGTSSVVLDGGAALGPEVVSLVVSNGTLIVTPALGNASVQVYGPGTFTLYTGSPATFPNRLLLNDGSTFWKNNVSDTWSGPVMLTGNVTATVAGNAGSTLTVAGPISGTGSLTKNGPNPLILSGTNTFRGGTTLQAGTVSIATYTNLPALGPLTFCGGNLQLTGTAITNLNRYAVNWNSFNGGLDVSHVANSVTITNAIGGGGSLVKGGAGTLVLASDNSSYSGWTTVSQGTLKALTVGSLGRSFVSITNGATLELDNPAAMSPSAGLFLQGDTNLVALNFSGTQSLGALVLNGSPCATGTWGAPGSSAVNQSPAFTGPGIVSVSGGAVAPIFNVNDYGATPDNNADDDGLAIQNCLNAAMAFSAANNVDCVVKFSAGTYAFNQAVQRFYLTNKTSSGRLVVDGNGCTLLNTCSAPMHLGFAATDSANISLQNLTLRSSRCMWVEGDVLQIDPANLRVKIQLHADSPSPLAWGALGGGSASNNLGFCYFPEPGLYGCLRPNGPSFYNVLNAIQDTADSNWWCYLDTTSISSTVQPGDSFYLWSDYIHWHTFDVSRSSNCALKNITLKTGGCFGILASNVRGLLVDGFVFQPETNRIIATARDGIHSQNSTNLTIRNCVIGFNGDDCINTGENSVKVVNALIENNVFCYSRRHALLAGNNSDGQVLRNNQVWYIAGSLVGSYDGSLVSYNIHHLAVSNNFVYSSARLYRQAVNLYLPNRDGSDVIVANNRFFEIPTPGISISGVSNVTVAGNFISPGSRDRTPTTGEAQLLALNHAPNVMLSGNSTALYDRVVSLSSDTTLTPGSQTSFDRQAGFEFTHPEDILEWSLSTNVTSMAEVNGQLQVVQVSGARSAAINFFTNRPVTTSSSKYVYLKLCCASNAPVSLQQLKGDGSLLSVQTVTAYYTSAPYPQVLRFTLADFTNYSPSAVYGVKLIVGADTGSSFKLDYFRVSDGDYDGDGIADEVDGLGDADNDGIENYADPKWAPPVLAVRQTGANLELSWPLNRYYGLERFTLQMQGGMAGLSSGPSDWLDLTSFATNYYLLPLSNSSGFFRLKGP